MYVYTYKIMFIHIHTYVYRQTYILYICAYVEEDVHMT